MVPRRPRLPSGGIVSLRASPTASLSLHTKPPLVLTSKPGDVLWLVISRSRVHWSKLMCVFTPFVGSAAPSPTLKAAFLILPPFVSPFKHSNERQLGSVKIHPFFCLACQLFFFWLFLRWDAVEIHSALTSQRFQNVKTGSVVFKDDAYSFLFSYDDAVFVMMQGNKYSSESLEMKRDLIISLSYASPVFILLFIQWSAKTNQP